MRSTDARQVAEAVASPSDLHTVWQRLCLCGDEKAALRRDRVRDALEATARVLRERDTRFPEPVSVPRTMDARAQTGSLADRAVHLQGTASRVTPPRKTR